MDSAYVIIHVCGSKNVNAGFVRELNVIDICAVGFDVGPVVNVVVGIHQTNVFDPTESLLGKLGVGSIVCISGKPSSQIEEATIGNRVLVIVSSEVWVHLPS